MVKQGQVIGKRYEVLEELGRGGMGTVYRAEDLQLKRSVALKVLAPHLARDTRAVKRFEREAQAAAKLRHPSIVTIFEVDQEDELHYIGMELVEGRALDEIIKEQSPLSFVEVVPWLNQIASALDHAHSTGMVHRDVKPANIIVRSDGGVVLTDFGIAWVSDSTRLTATDQVGIGTPFYSSPEQIKGHEPTGQSDIYSLGAVIYEVLAARPPFTGDTMTLLYSHVHEPPPPIRSIRPDLPPAIEEVLERSLAKEPSDRYASTTALAEAFAIASGVTPSQPLTPTTDRPGFDFIGDIKPMWWAIGAAVVMVLIILGAIFMMRNFDSDGEGQVVAVVSPSGDVSDETLQGGGEIGTPPTEAPTEEATNTPTPIDNETVGIAGDNWTVINNSSLPDDVERRHLAITSDKSGNVAIGWFEPASGLWVMTSSDQGQSWSSEIRVKRMEEESLQLDNEWLTYDDSGNLLASWVENSGETPRIVAALGEDKGISWSSETVDDGFRQQVDERYGTRVIPLGNERLASVWVEKSNPYALYSSTSKRGISDWGIDVETLTFDNAITPGNLIRMEESLYIGVVEQTDQGYNLYLIASNDLGDTWTSQQINAPTSLKYSPPRLAVSDQDELFILVSANSLEEGVKANVLGAIIDVANNNINSPGLRIKVNDSNGETATIVGQVDLIEGTDRRLYAVWSDNRDGTLRTYLSISEDGDAWSPDIQVGEATNLSDLSLTTDSKGTLYIIGNAKLDSDGQNKIFLSKSDPDPNSLDLDVRQPSTPIPAPTSPPTPTPTEEPTLEPTEEPTLVPTEEPTPAPPPRPETYKLAYSKWDGEFHNVYIGDTNGENEVLLITRAAGPSFAPDKSRLYMFGEQGINQQWRYRDEGYKVLCDFGTISGGIVALDLIFPVTDVCEGRFDKWFCQRKELGVGKEPAEVCSAKDSNISLYQNIDWKEGTARWASVSPRNDAVAYDAHPGGPTYRIYFKNVIGFGGQANIEILGQNASWSPDGERLVFQSGPNNLFGIYVSDRSGGGITQLTNSDKDNFPAWSPAGGKIAFHRETSGNVDIWIMNEDGSDLQQLTTAPGPDTLPVFTPDGRQIIFRSARNDSNWGIWKMNSDGSVQETIIPDAGVGPDWAFSRMDVKE